jgi:hypothetical protein
MDKSDENIISIYIYRWNFGGQHSLVSKVKVSTWALVHSGWGRRGGLFWLGSLTFPIFEFQKLTWIFIGLAYQGKDIMFRFIIEYSSLTDFGPYIVALFL